MDFSEALKQLKQGERMTRLGWKNAIFVVMMPPLYLPPFNTQEPGAKVNDRTAKHIGNDTPLDSQAYFAVMTVGQKWQPGWTPSTQDVLADDWANAGAQSGG